MVGHGVDKVILALVFAVRDHNADSFLKIKQVLWCFLFNGIPVVCAPALSHHDQIQLVPFFGIGLVKVVMRVLNGRF